MTSLDAVRGIAACVVVLWHCYLTIPDGQRERIGAAAWSVPLRPLFNGNAAVIVFFILSGYVLSLPYLRGSQPPFETYVVRRVCRIYIPFAASLLLALLLYGLTDRTPTQAANGWINGIWPPNLLSGTTLAGHLLMLGTTPNLVLNPPTWTLVHEMRVSLAFPLLIVLCRDTRAALAAILALIVVPKELLGLLGQNTHPIFAGTVGASLLWSAEVAAFFVTGILLSKHRGTIAVWWARLPAALRPLLFLVPAAVFCVNAEFASVKDNLLYDGAAATLVVLAVESPALRRILDGRVPQWLGRISYSLYLIHLPLMLATVPVLIGRVPFGVMVLAILGLSLAAATLMHAAVELPAIHLGRLLTRPPARPALEPSPG